MVLQVFLWSLLSQEPMQVVFGGQDFMHRWSGKNQHEFTPPDQPNLQAWTDMLSFIVYPEVYDGEDLARLSNHVLELYKSRGKILKTESTPKKRKKPAEHFIFGVLFHTDYLEAVFVRFKLIEGSGVAMIYSHRVYGKKAGDPMSAWLSENGPTMEGHLKLFDQWPSYDQLSTMKTPPPKTPEWIQSLRDGRKCLASNQMGCLPDPLPDVQGFVGLARYQVIEKIGEPDGSTRNFQGVIAEVHHTIGEKWVYRFYKLKEGTRGGGPELICTFNEQGACDKAQWIHTQ